MTRMWMLPPSRMCRQHLLGEHKELHQLVGALNKNKRRSVEGHAVRGQVQTRSIAQRHEALVEEMLRRGYKHLSPLPGFEPVDLGEVDAAANLADLCTRCPACRANFEEE